MLLIAGLFLSMHAQAFEKQPVRTFSSPVHGSSMVINGATMLSTYGESDVYAVRWPNGVVYVQDNTNYPYLDQVLSVLNRDLDQVHLEKAPYPELAGINIEWADLDGPCGTTVTSMDESHRSIGGAKIKISNLFRTGKACTGNTSGFPLYLHEMAHAMGFSRHTREGHGLMDAELVMNANLSVTPAFRTFFKTLYALPAGSMIPERYFPDTKEDLSTTALSLFIPKSFHEETLAYTVPEPEMNRHESNVHPLVSYAPTQIQKLAADPAAPEVLPGVMLKGKHFVRIRYRETKTQVTADETTSRASVVHSNEPSAPPVVIGEAGFFWQHTPATKIKSRIMEFGTPSVVMASMEKKQKHPARRIKKERLF